MCERLLLLLTSQFFICCFSRWRKKVNEETNLFYFSFLDFTSSSSSIPFSDNVKSMCVLAHSCSCSVFSCRLNENCSSSALCVKEVKAHWEGSLYDFLWVLSAHRPELSLSVIDAAQQKKYPTSFHVFHFGGAWLIVYPTYTPFIYVMFRVLYELRI